MMRDPEPPIDPPDTPESDAMKQPAISRPRARLDRVMNDRDYNAMLDHADEMIRMNREDYYERRQRMSDKPTSAEMEAVPWGKSIIFEDQYEIRNAEMRRDVVTCDRIDHRLSELCHRPAEYVVVGQYRPQEKGRYTSLFRRLCAQCAAEWATLHGLTFPPKEEDDE